MSKARAALVIGLFGGCAAREPAPAPLLRVDQAKVAARLALFERLTSEEELLDDGSVSPQRAETTHAGSHPEASFGGERFAAEQSELGSTQARAQLGAGGNEGGARLLPAP